MSAQKTFIITIQFDTYSQRVPLMIKDTIEIIKNEKYMSIES